MLGMAGDSWLTQGIAYCETNTGHNASVRSLDSLGHFEVLHIFFIASLSLRPAGLC